jgi:hypothetical protein
VRGGAYRDTAGLDVSRRCSRPTKFAPYAVLSARFEVVKHFDGVDRTLGWRLPGTLSGWVTLTEAKPQTLYRPRLPGNRSVHVAPYVDIISEVATRILKIDGSEPSLPLNCLRHV